MKIQIEKISEFSQRNEGKKLYTKEEREAWFKFLTSLEAVMGGYGKK